MQSKPALLWLRRDLRLADNPALIAACGHKAALPVVIWSPEEEDRWAPGAASRWWFHHALAALDGALQAMGSRLIIRRGPSLPALLALIRETGAGAVYWNRLYEPRVLDRDGRVQKSLGNAGIHVESFNAALLHEPWDVRNRQGDPFQVFTPFWRACQEQGEPGEPAPKPRSIPAPPRWPRSLDLAELNMLPKLGWADGFSRFWKPGEKGAQRKLKDFLAESLADYPRARDLPDEVGTSRLSPHLHFGEIGPRQVWQAVQRKVRNSGPAAHEAAGSFLRQLGWREFAYHLLYHFPFTPEKPLRAKFATFPWDDTSKALAAWQKGLTGYPLVDAGMRELWATGWMHNRVRMIVASFLVKDLLLPWNDGAKWFWDTLVDADLANNTLGWQWAAGCGADAAPYFRIFNPVLQAEKFDPQGDYVRRWIPELKFTPLKWVHKPWKAPADIRGKCDYPAPVIDHAEARDRALQAFAFTRGGNSR
jgi:deoxyribodipyrimidine photo-lyase